MRSLWQSQAGVSLDGGMAALTTTLMRCDKLAKRKEKKSRGLFL